MALAMTLLLLVPSPSLMAITMGQIKAGIAAGGQGSAPNLANAGAASAALTAALAKKSQQQSAAVVTGMQELQAQAATAAKANPATTLPNDSQGNPQTVSGDSTVHNGLKAGWLEPYVKGGGPGIVNDVAVTTSWSGASITPVDPAKNTAAAKDPNYIANPANYVNIQQTKQNAYLYWNKFNVGPKTTVNFDQSAGGQNSGNWTAFNKVMSASDPTHIFGNITAQGQVYVLNQNGILFHNGSTVNTHALVASTLPINRNLAGDALDKVTGRGIANNPDSQFLFSSLKVSSGKIGPTPTFDPSLTSFGASANPGNVVVEKGASIVSPVNEAGVGGLVALVGPNVRNDGAISTAAGQTILAAGLQVALIPHPSKDPSLRGMDVTVGQVNDPDGIVTPLTGSAGSVVNNGLISVPVGNATLAGKSLSLGEGAVIDSTTSVALNGRIDLLASYGATPNAHYTPPDSITGSLLNGPALLPGSTGNIDLGAGSVLRILPDLASSATVVGSSLPLNSIVDMIGNTVHFGNGSILEAPGAASTAGALTEYDSTTLQSGVSIGAGNWFIPSPDNPKPVFVFNSGQIYLDQDSMIDVSGTTGVQVASSQNYVTLQLRGPELANSPLQRGNLAVRGKDITVDLRNTGTYNGIYWSGTPLGDATGYAGLIQRGVGQLTENGGSVSLSSGDSVVMQAGSSINVSGGWTHYSGGNFSTTKLITSDGRIVDISKATPDQVYAGILKDPVSVYEAPYFQGASGGSLSIQAPSVALTGSLYGLTVAGQRQVLGPSGTSQLPQYSSLSLSLAGQKIQNSQILPVSAYAPSVTFDGVQSRGPLPTFALNPDGSSIPLPSDWSSAVSLPSSLLADGGFGSLSVASHDGVITVPQGTTLAAPAGGSISLEASSIGVGGFITAPGGKISLTADLVPFSLIPWEAPATLAPVLGLMTIDSTGEKVLQYGSYDPAGTQVLHADGSVSTEIATRVDQGTFSSGLIKLDSGAVLNVSGSVADEFTGATGDFPVTLLNGGSISIAAHSAVLPTGTLLDVSGGGLISPTGKVSYGKAGKVSIATGTDPQSFSVQSALPLGDIHDGSVQLGAALRGYAGVGQSGGSLSVTAESVQVGGSAPEGNVLWLNPTFFSQGGFSAISLKGIGNGLPGASDYLPGIVVSPGTQIHPVVASQIFSGSGGSLDLVPFAPPSPLNAAASLSFSASGISDTGLAPGQQVLSSGDLFVGNGALIQVDPQLIVSGTTVAASAGAVSLSGKTITLLGSIIAPGGSISITAPGSFPSNDENPPQSPQVTAYLGPDVRLSTAGKVLLTSDPSWQASRFGVVQSGGSIALVGNLFLDGSSLDASGASGVLDLRAPQVGRQTGIIPTRVDGAGGSISLTGKNALYSAASLSAGSGGPTAPGGSLTITSGSPANGSLLELIQSGGTPTVSSSSAAPDSVLAAWQAINNGLQITTMVGAEFGSTAYMSAINALGGGFLAVSTFSSGGFGKLDLRGNVILDDSVTLSAPSSLSIASDGILTSYSSGSSPDPVIISLSSAHVIMGQPFLGPLAPGTTDQTYLGVPTSGRAELDVTAKFVDLGNLSLQQIGKVVVDASGGAIRGDGTFDMAGDLTLKAALIYPASGSTFAINAYNHDSSTGAATGSASDNDTTLGGSVTIERSGSAGLPLSAGGSLVINAATITQGGFLAAPFGSISLGSASGGGADVLAGVTVKLPATTSLELARGSITSVSGKDPVSGVALTIPFGYSPDGSVWIDPSGTEISTSGIQSKGVMLSAQSLSIDQAGLIDAAGGGEMTATHWISGLGGTLNYAGVPMSHGSGGTSWTPYRLYNSTFNYVAGDLVADNQGRVWTARQSSSGVAPVSGLYWSQLPQSYALVPGFSGAPDPAMASSTSMNPGMTITIGAGSPLNAGTYTLLPASYASVPGAYLVSALSSQSTASGLQPDGSAWVYGSLNNSLDASVIPSPLAGVFEIDSPSVLAAKVSAPLLHADAFFPSSIEFTRNADGGKVAILGSSSLQLLGSLHGAAANGGRGAIIDINSGRDFVINQKGEGSFEGATLLSADILNTWNYGSLLIGGSRQTSSGGQTPVAISAANITVSDSTMLTGNDIILAANNSVTLGQQVTLKSDGSSTAPNKILSVTGDGAILRVSSDSSVSLLQSGTDQNVIGGLVIGADSRLVGQGVVFSTSLGGTIDPSVTISSGTTAFSAGRLNLDFTGGVSDSSGIVLGGNALNTIFSSGIVNLNSFSTINISGEGSLGGTALTFLGLHSGGIFGDGSSVDAIQADAILIDNPSAVTDPSTSLPYAGSGGEGKLTLTGSVVTLGTGEVAIGGFQSAEIDASGGFVGSGKGTLNSGGDLIIKTPVMTGAGGSDTTINVLNGTLTTTSDGSSVVKTGLADTLSLNASAITLGAPINLPGGSISVNQSGAGQTLSISSTLDVSGTTRKFFDKTESVDGGSISLSSAGDVKLAAGASLKLDAATSGTRGSAGTLSISAPNGAFIFDEVWVDPSVSNDSHPADPISAKSLPGGAGASFSLDANSLPSFSLLESLLAWSKPQLDESHPVTPDGFNAAQSFRIRSGDVAIDTAVKAQAFSLTADNGSINVTGAGAIDASGKTGGSIALQAGGSVILNEGSSLSVRGDTYDAAGKGGDIFLSAGAAINGQINPDAVLDLQSGSSIDLRVAALPTRLDQFGGTLHLRAPINVEGSDIQIAGLNATLDPGMSFADVSETDSLASIADRTGLSISMLQRLNGLTSDGLSIGGTLSIPERTHEISASESLAQIAKTYGQSAASIDALLPSPVLGTTITIPSTTYSVSQDDTLDSVATLFGTTADELLQQNPTIDPSSSLIDQTTSIIIPDRTHIVTATDSVSSIATQFNASESDVNNVLPLIGSVVAFAATESRVGYQDTVDAVASRFVITPDQLRAKNSLASDTGLRIGSSLKTSVGVSRIAVEGYRLYDLTEGGGDIASVIDQARGDAQTFFGSPGANSDTANQILARLSPGISGPNAALINLAPGVEIINRGGDLTLSQDWDLSQFRTGVNSAPGFLTLRSSGNVVLNGSLSDGFSSSAYTATLLNQNTALPANFQSWSYQLSAGADLASANHKAVVAGSSGSVQLGATGFDYSILGPGEGVQTKNFLTRNALQQNGQSYFQVVRTGTGDIFINAAGDFQLRTPFASVYTAGIPVLDQNLGGAIDTPTPYFTSSGLDSLSLGSAQQVATDGSGNVLYLTDVAGNPVLDGNGMQIPVMNSYPAQFTYAGGNISVNVGGSIERVYGDTGKPDSQRELPSNWLYRQGQIDPSTGNFSIQHSQRYVTDTDPNSATFGQVLLDPNGSPMAVPTDSILSTAWWVDFSNFFEGVGALGGGNIAIKAGKDVSNVDAVIPTQARAAGSMLVDPAGGSIQSLADQFGVSVPSLLQLNVSRVASLQPDAGSMLSDAYGNSYTVQEGDTLQSIAANWDSLSAAPTPTGMTLGTLLAGNADQLASLVPPGEIRVPMLASSSSLVETGGGDLSVTSARDINAGVYYVERGQGTLKAGGSITTDSTRDPFLPALMNGGAASSDPNAFLPTSLFLGKGGFDISARGDVLLGPTGNVFLMPQSINNGLNTSYFSTYASDDVVRVSSLVRSVTLRQASGGYGFGGTISGLQLWMSADITPIGSILTVAGSQPWLRLNLNDISTFGAQMALQPSSLEVVSFGGGISFQGNYTASPSATGQISLLAAESITGLTPNGVSPGAGNPWSAATLNLSDVDPGTIPAPLTPMNDYQEVGATKSPFNAAAFAESGSTSGSYGVLQTKQQLHDSTLLHLSDTEPVAIYSTGGDVADFTLFSPKKTKVFAEGSIADVGLYIQNLTASDTSIVSASGDIRLYNNQTPYQKAARAAGAGLTDPQRYNLSILQSGDLQVSGPGALAVLAGGNIDLGNGANNSDGTGVGITSIGNARNPSLSFVGADITMSAGVPFEKITDPVTGNAFVNQVKQVPDSALYFGELVFHAAGVSLPIKDSNGTDLQDSEQQLRQGVANLVNAVISSGNTSLSTLATGMAQVPGNSALVTVLKKAGSLAALDLSNLSVAQISSLAAALFEQNPSLRSAGDTALNNAAFHANSIEGISNLGESFADQRFQLELNLFNIVLRETGRNFNHVQRFTDSVMMGPDAEHFVAILQQNLGTLGLPANLIVTKQSLSRDSKQLTSDQKMTLERALYSIVKEQKGDTYVKQYANGYKTYDFGESAIATLFGGSAIPNASDITLWSRDVRTKNGGSISLLAPSGGISLSSYSSGSSFTPPGIVTEHGGEIDIYTKEDVSIGIGRIFTLRGGDIMMWSDKGNIAAGSSAKTVATAPPTRVLIDPTSGNVQTDLAGLATGGGIGVLATVAGISPGAVDLIAPSGYIDAGDAGIRSSGSFNYAAKETKNFDNTTAQSTTGNQSSSAPASPPASAPAPAAPPAASTAAAANNASSAAAAKGNASSSEADQTPSIFSIDVLGYGGGGDGDKEDEQQKSAADASVAPVQASL